MSRLGVALGDVLMVHASLRRIGPVEGGAAGVITAIDRAVGDSGTSMMTLGARDDWSWVNEHPEEARPGLLAGAEPFDARHTPADPDVGALAESYRRHPGTVVSDHPEGRFGARGRLAEALMADQPWDDYYGPGSPLERLVTPEARCSVSAPTSTRSPSSITPSTWPRCPTSAGSSGIAGCGPATGRRPPGRDPRRQRRHRRLGRRRLLRADPARLPGRAAPPVVWSGVRRRS